MKYEEKTTVVIIGGGSAGIAAAHLLHAERIDFWLVEAEDRLGGRIKNFNFNGYNVEDGANWIHGEYDANWDPNNESDSVPFFRNPLWTWQRHFKGTDKFMGGNFTDYNREEFRNDKALVVDEKLEEECWKEVEAALDICGKKASGLWDQYCKNGVEIDEVEKSDTTIRKCIYDNLGYADFNNEKKKICDAIIWEEIEFETGIFDASLMHNYPLNNINGKPFNDRDFLITQGFNIWIDNVASQFKNRFLLKEKVTTIEYSSTDVEVFTEDGSMIKADYAICTVPLGVLQRGDIDFDPPFSKAKQDAIQGMKMGSYEKVYVIFPTVFWNNEEEVLINVAEGMKAHESIMAWGLNLNHEKYFPGSKMFTFHCMGDAAKRVASQPETDTLKEVNKIMRKLFGAKATRATKIHVTNWTHNPSSYGSWSAMPYGYGKKQWELMRKNEERLFFAGEHTSSNCGFVHAASIEGWVAARDVIKEIKGYEPTFSNPNLLPKRRRGCDDEMVPINERPRPSSAPDAKLNNFLSIFFFAMEVITN